MYRKKHASVMLALYLGAISFAPLAVAEVPVVDITTQNQSMTAKSGAVTSGIDAGSVSAAATSSLPLDQRVAILERQLNNMTQMDLVGQINSLQQEVAKLRGKLDVQTHTLQQLSEQMKAQYQDIDARLSSGQTKKLVKPAVTPAMVDDVALNQPSSANTTTTSTSSAATLDPGAAIELQEQAVYQAAIDLSKKGDYVRATSAFQHYLTKYPNGKFAANGHFWLGEIYLIQGQPDPAAGEFNTVITSFPTHAKVPDAMLKLGQAYYDKGDFKQAKLQFTKVQKQFANTPAAQGAMTRLQKMQQEGKGK